MDEKQRPSYGKPEPILKVEKKATTAENTEKLDRLKLFFSLGIIQCDIPFTNNDAKKVFRLGKLPAMTLAQHDTKETTEYLVDLLKETQKQRPDIRFEEIVGWFKKVNWRLSQIIEEECSTSGLADSNSAGEHHKTNEISKTSLPVAQAAPESIKTKDDSFSMMAPYSESLKLPSPKTSLTNEEKLDRLRIFFSKDMGLKYNHSFTKEDAKAVFREGLKEFALTEIEESTRSIKEYLVKLLEKTRKQRPKITFEEIVGWFTKAGEINLVEVIEETCCQK